MISFFTSHSVFHLQNLFYHHPQINSSPPVLGVRCRNSPSAKHTLLFSCLTSSWTWPGCGPGVVRCGLLPSVCHTWHYSLSYFFWIPSSWEDGVGKSCGEHGGAPSALRSLLVLWWQDMPVHIYLHGRTVAPDSSISSSSPNSALPDDEWPEIPSYWVYAFMGSIIWTYTILIFFCQLVERAKKIGTRCSISAEGTFGNLWLKGDCKQLP